MGERMIALVDTIPKDARNGGSVNLGFEIVKTSMGATPYHFTEKLPGNEDTIAFNVFYPMHLLNILPFLHKNGIEPLKAKRKSHKIIVGGQGVSNLPAGCLDEIADEVFIGEYDGTREIKGWKRSEGVTSEVCIKGEKAVIELTRGCRHKCKFCEYSWVSGGPYREKSIDQVADQIKECIDKKIYHVNFLSANFAGYSKLHELLDLSKNLRVLNSDASPLDAYRLLPRLNGMKKRFIKIGVESFDEKTRVSMGKGISDTALESLISDLLEKCNGLHLYLIYGLPGDNYKRWFDWIEILGKERKRHKAIDYTLFGEEIVNSKNIRIEFNLTNFEPCRGTPLGNAPECDFNEKDRFLKEWVSCLHKNAFVQNPDMEYKNCGGRLGRKNGSYDLLMSLKNGNADLRRLLAVFPTGVTRSIDDIHTDKANGLLTTLV
jgi:hypothetical protein